MERLTNKKEADAQRREYENRLKNGYPRNIPEERFLKLAAYEDTGLEPEDIEALRDREQGLAELLVNVSCGCAVSYTRLEELAQAEKDGRLTALPPNTPLTLEELQEMDGEPVWVHSLDGDGKDTWAFVDADCEMVRIFVTRFSVKCMGTLRHFKTYGKTWLAYRRKPEKPAP